MTNDMRGLSNAEIDTVAGGGLLLAALGACIEYTLHATDKGGTQETGAETDTDTDTDSDTDTDTDTDTDSGGDTGR
jgi:hypothetical protein